MFASQWECLTADYVRAIWHVHNNYDGLDLANDIHIHLQEQSQVSQPRNSFLEFHEPILHKDDEYDKDENQAHQAVSLRLEQREYFEVAEDSSEPLRVLLLTYIQEVLDKQRSSEQYREVDRLLESFLQHVCLDELLPPCLDYYRAQRDS